MKWMEKKLLGNFVKLPLGITTPRINELMGNTNQVTHGGGKDLEYSTKLQMEKRTWKSQPSCQVGEKGIKW
jgi:hypothetical protein